MQKNKSQSVGTHKKKLIYVLYLSIAVALCSLLGKTKKCRVTKNLKSLHVTHVKRQ